MIDRWLVVVDPQRVFADPDSPWGSPMFADTLEPIRALAAALPTIVTRWVPAPDAERIGSWRTYFAAWPFADRPADDPMFDVVPDLADLAAEATVVSAPTFGKWDAVQTVTGPAPTLVVAGVSTDCCVLSTVLAAADAGATVEVVADACAGSSPENHRRALDAMALYAPQVTIV
ncbi:MULTISPECIES: cysteine hydrolase [unclassified Aeromicrobium]|uniref:cysteine hydrolase family protein n=1 Tax=unclassified Aeromicrobium TaxID=2633570 RepID=UPI002889E51A|nr:MULTISPECIES: cysteine hydrolase [unclassified Aeromicrobium]